MSYLVKPLLAVTLLGAFALSLWPVPAPAATSALPAFSHIFIIVMENKESEHVIGNADAPYFNQLAQTYGLATQSYGQRHPSLPNYLALTSGSTQGITTDCTDCFVDAPNIVDQLETAGRSWKAYIEDMPSPCFVGDYGPFYAQRHNPFIYYDNIRTNPTRCANVVPFEDFSTDLQANALPDYIWITPNLCNDEHDCSLETGDAWLNTWVPQILASPAWQQDGLLLITYDEGASKAGCCTGAVGGHIPTLVISPLGKPAYQSSVPYDHYSLLRTVEEAWGLPLLANAASSRSPSLSDFFAEPTVLPTPPLTATAPPIPLPTSTPVQPSERNFQVNLPLVRQ